MQTEQEHKERHVELHRALDELVADFFRHTGKFPSDTSLMSLMEWSHQQSLSPTPTPSDT